MLILSIVAILLGFGAGYWLNQISQWGFVLKGFVASSIVLIVFQELMPHCQDALGWMSWLYVILGFGALFLIEKLARNPKFASLALFIAFAVHAFMDGMAMGTSHLSDTGWLLGLAVILHRVPVGLILSSKDIEIKLGLQFLAVIILVSTFGYFGVDIFMNEALLISSLFVIQSITGGALLHVVLGQKIFLKSQFTMTLIGYVLGGLFFGILALSGHHEHAEHTHSLTESFFSGWMSLLPMAVLLMLCLKDYIGLSSSKLQ